MKETPFCVLPWIHSYVDGMGNRGLCCIAKPYDESEKINDLSLEEYGEWLSSIRAEMMEGKVPAVCGGCDKGKVYESQRHGINKNLKDEFYKATQDVDKDLVDFYKPISFDYRIDNTCNLSCTYCSSHLSSKIAQKVKKANLKQSDPIYRPEKYIEELKNYVDKNEYGVLYFASGEPFVNPLHWELLDQIQKKGNQKNYKLNYNTNLSMNKYKGQSILERIDEFKSVSFNVSLDSTGEVAELLRDGLDFEKFKKHLKEFKAYKEQKDGGGLEGVKVYCVLSIPALINIKSFEEFCDDMGLEIIYSPVIGGSQEIMLMISSLGKKYLNKILETLPDDFLLPDFVYETNEIEDLPRDKLRRALAYFYLLDKASGGSKIIEYFKTHPLTKDWYSEIIKHACFDSKEIESYGVIQREDENSLIHVKVKDDLKNTYSSKEIPFCVLPWIHSYVDGEGNRGLCCIAKPYDNNDEVNSFSLDEYGEWLTDIRRDMLEGKVPDVCRDCGKGKVFQTQREDINRSLAEEYFQAINHRDEGLETKYAPVSFDYRIDNACNLSCTYCSAHLSSKIATKVKKANLKQDYPTLRPKKYMDEITDRLKKNDFGVIYFGSGEPFINPLHWDILESLKAQDKEQNYKLIYNTNLSVNRYKGESIISRIKAFKYVGINISLDSTGEMAELLREGLDFEKWKRNFDEFNRAGLLEDTKIYCVLSIPALINLEEFVRYCQSINLEIIFTPVVGRAHEILLMTSSLGEKYKKQIIETLPEYIELPEFIYETNELDELSREQLRNAIAYFYLIDEEKGGSELIKFFETHPLTRDWYNEIVQYAYFDMTKIDTYGLVNNESDNEEMIQEINFEGDYLEDLLAKNIKRVLSLKFMKFDKDTFTNMKKYFNQNNKLIIHYEQPSRSLLRKQLIKNSGRYQLLKDEVEFFEEFKTKLESEYELKVNSIRPEYSEFFKTEGILKRAAFTLVLCLWFFAPDFVSMREKWELRQLNSSKL